MSAPQSVVFLLGLSAGLALLAGERPSAVASPPDQGVRAGLLPPVPAPTATALDHPSTALSELQVEILVEHVLARNPSLAQMVAAWQAASARYPQVTSLEDPMFTGIVGPASFGSRDVDGAYRLEISQKFPFPGKLHLRGENAQAEASAAGNDVHDMRLQLIESARSAFADYYLVARALAVNDEALRRLAELRQNAAARARTGLAPEQDMLQADVEIGRQRERQLDLEQTHKIAVARLNTLMHLPPETPLPPPPVRLPVDEVLPGPETLRGVAFARRPDLQALADRIAADEANLGLAHKEYYPDVEVMAAYDAFWQRPEQDLRPMVGVRLNLPIRLERRRGAVAEAQARLAQRRAELARLTDQVNFQVVEADAQVSRAAKVVRLYEQTILRDAKLNVDAARTAYANGKIPAISLIEAQRNEIGLRDRYYEATADYHRRRAALERVIGGPLTTPSAPSTGSASGRQ